MTLHPRAKNRTLHILSPLRDSAWFGGFLTLIGVIMGLILTAPDNEHFSTALLWRTVESFGRIKDNKKHEPELLYPIAGNSFHMLWSFCIFLLMCAYNVELRAKTINQEYEKVPTSFYDLEFPSNRAALIPNQGSTYLYVILINVTCSISCN